MATSGVVVEEILTPIPVEVIVATIVSRMEIAIGRQLVGVPVLIEEVPAGTGKHTDTKQRTAVRCEWCDSCLVILQRCVHM